MIHRLCLSPLAIISTALALFAIPQACLAQTANPTFKQGAIPAKGNTSYTMSVSSDKKAGIIIFDALEENLQGLVGSPFIAARDFSISLPLDGAAKDTKIVVYLEGSIFRLKGTDISLIATVNGEPHVMDFARFAPSQALTTEECKQLSPTKDIAAIREKMDAKPSDASKAPKLLKDPSNAQLIAENEGEFVQCILFNAQSSSDLRINVLFAMHRHNQDSGGYLNVNSIGAIIQ